MTASLWLWVGFSLCVLAMLALDLGVFHRKSLPGGHEGSADVERRVDCAGLALQRGRLALARRRQGIGIPHRLPGGNLQTYPCVQARMADGSLHVQAWFFKIATAELYAYDPESKQFEPLAGVSPPKP